MIKTLVKKRSLILSLLMLAVIVMAMQFYIERRYLEQLQSVQSETISERLSTIRYQLESEQKHHLYNELVVAIGQHQTVVYQPIVDAASGQVSGSWCAGGRKRGSGLDPIPLFRLPKSAA